MKTQRSNTPSLQQVHDHHMQWIGETGTFSILGALSMDVSSLRVSLHIQATQKRKQRLKLDLYDYKQITGYCTYLSEEEGFDYGRLEADLLTLTELLEQYRENLYQKDYTNHHQHKPPRLSLTKEKEYVEQLSDPNLLEHIQEKLSNIGIAGEDNNRLLLLIIGTSYKHQPLHAVIQSSSGSGKSHLINTIADCFPEEDVISLSRITSKSLYHYRKETLTNKLILIQDFDGLDDEALYAFRELQSYGKLTTSMTGKDAFGNHIAKLHTVEGHFASFGATTKTLYTDNTSRSILLKIDESKEQTKRVLSYIPPDRETITNQTNHLKNMIRLLKPQTIHNPYAEKIILPHHVPMARRLNTQLQQFIQQITYLHQYQREQDQEGRLLTTKEDIEKGISLFFECIWLKVDELDPNTRLFFEQLKTHLNLTQQDQEGTTEEDQKEKTFTQREIRQALNLSKTSLQRHIKSLMELEYLAIVSGTANKGYRYAIQYLDNTQQLKEALMKTLQQAILKP